MKRVIVLLLALLICGATAARCLVGISANPGNAPSEPETIRYQDISGEYLFVKNLDATEMMLRTLHEYMGDDNIQIQSFVPEDTTCLAERTWNPAWAARLTGGPIYCVEAWDIYKNGEFRGTTYQVGKI